MNLLLFEQRELRNEVLHLGWQDRRARHIEDVLGLKAGDTLRVGMVNGSVGTGRIRTKNAAGIEIEITLAGMVCAERDITLILALPRPIMLQRILKQATVIGVRQFHLIRSARVQKSYFQSSVLNPLNIHSLLVQGLEQAMDTMLPEVFIHERFRPFVEDVVPGLPKTGRLLADPEAQLALPDIHRQNLLENQLVLAIGPEGGWNDFELHSFRAQGFASFSSGSRIFHVDTAVLVLLSQLILLQDLKR